MDYPSRLFEIALLLVSVLLALWGGLGLWEYFSGLALVAPLQNPAFPPGLQFLHFAIILAAGVIFPLGWLTRWRHTPITMVVVYSAMGMLCAVETLDFLDGLKFDILFLAEITAYVGISVFLCTSARMRDRFERSN